MAIGPRLRELAAVQGDRAAIGDERGACSYRHFHERIVRFGNALRGLGLQPGDRWCLCAARWREALEAGAAPRVILAATHEATLEVVDLKDLKRYAIDLA